MRDAAKNGGAPLYSSAVSRPADGREAKKGEIPCFFRYCNSLLVILLFLPACNAPLSEADLAGRIEKCAPQWQAYQEDIKGQVGARPVAEWKGEPVKAVQEGSTLSVTFRLSGPWAARDSAIPVLTRDSFGETRQSVSAVRDGALTTYEFALNRAEKGSVLPWVEVKFPNGGKRIVFDQYGAWSAM